MEGDGSSLSKYKEGETGKGKLRVSPLGLIESTAVGG